MRRSINVMSAGRVRASHRPEGSSILLRTRPLAAIRVAALLVLASLRSASGAAPLPLETVVETDVMVAMRDGVKLATDIYRPGPAGKPGEDRFPVLVSRTPYNKAAGKSMGMHCASRGYVAVVQDCRGRFQSQGDFYPLLREGQDGYDTIEWAAAQPWSNGKVGSMGGSYVGWAQYQAAAERPPHLVAMFASVAGSQFRPYYGGIPTANWPSWILLMASNSPESARRPAAAETLARIFKDTLPWLALHPQKRAAVLDAFPGYKKIYDDFYAHPDNDAYWKQPGFDPTGRYDRIKDVPILMVGGWYDALVEGVLEGYTTLSRLHKTPKKLIVGPWPHAVGKSEAGDAAFGAQAEMNQLAMTLDWFDHWMKGRDYKLAGGDAVRLFRMGGGDGSRTPGGRLNRGGEWKEVRAWPPPGYDRIRYYFRESNRLDRGAPGKEKPATFHSDPDNPVPTVGGRWGSNEQCCAQDQVCSPRFPGCTDSRPLNERPDVLSFVSAPLQAPLDVTGVVKTRLWVSSDAPDTDFIIKLIDVYPDGTALLVLDGQIRARYRQSLERARLMKPGAVYPIDVEVGSTSSLFAAGHRIRLDIASSNFPKLEPNSNTGEPPGSYTRRFKARNTVYRDGARPSYLELPAAVPPLR
jgi:uncharacterized protein